MVVRWGTRSLHSLPRSTAPRVVPTVTLPAFFFTVGEYSRGLLEWRESQIRQHESF